jgi:heparin binding hemagglutinin HbhA
VINMPTVPTIEDVRKAGEQARVAVTNAFEQVRTPLLAAIGAADLATQAVVDAVNKTREQLTERAEAARSAVDELPTDVNSLREKLDPAELRKLVDEYADAAVKLYQHLAEQGEKALDKLRAQPQFKRAIDQLDQAVETAQQRAESAVEDARELADEVLGKVVRRTRSTGEKAAREVVELADDAADAVHEAGAQTAHEVRSTTRKAANRTNNVRKAANGSTKPTGTGKTDGAQS